MIGCKDGETVKREGRVTKEKQRGKERWEGMRKIVYKEKGMTKRAGASANGEKKRGSD